MSWTEEKVTQLRQMWGHGKSASEIAQIIGDVSRNAVIGKAHRLGLSGQPSPARVRKRKPVPVVGRPVDGATILALTERMCRWPHGDPKSADFQFCGRPALPGASYCADHTAMAYQQPERKRGERRAAHG
ncbi:MAG: GcrA family cell cycle regulator [Alphaproteobacteria bacterium]